MKKNLEVKSEVVRMTCVFLTATILIAIVPALRAQSSIIAAGAKVELLAGGFEFTEGPASDKAGNVYFTDGITRRASRTGNASTILNRKKTGLSGSRAI